MTDLIVPYNYRPRAYQLPALQALDSGVKRACLVWHRRCLAEGTSILMADGSVKNIEDVRAGDKILAHDGNRVVEDEVVDCWHTGLKETVESRSSGQLPIVSTADHRFANTFEGCKKKITWDPVESLNPRKMVLLYSGVEHGTVNQPDLAEWLGYMLTDGYVVGTQQPKFTNVNKEILERVAQLTKSLWDIDVIWRKKGKAYDLGMSSGFSGNQVANPITAWFKQNSICERKSTRCLPSIVWQWDRETVGRFFAGVISGDGCIYVQKRAQKICGKTLSPCAEIKIAVGQSKQAAEDMYWLLRKHGIICAPISKDSRHDNWLVRIWNRDSVKRLLSFGRIYGKETQREKALAAHDCLRSRQVWNGCHRAHLKTAPGTPRPTYDLEIKNHHNFFANGYLVHNSGKDVTILNWVVKELVRSRQTCFYCLPTFSQARRVIWDAINNDGFRLIDHFPDQIVQARNVHEMKITLTNGSVFQLVGSDNYDRLVGTNPKIVVFSEAALSDSRAWDYLKPILTINRGTAIFVSTPRGRNWFYELYKVANDSPDWFAQRLTVDDTNVIGKDHIEREQREGMSEEMVLQEFFCDFNKGIDGAYYGRLLTEIDEKGQITNVPYDESMPVHTAWDLGIGDSTSIWFFQITPGGEIHVIDHYENEGEPLAHYVGVCNQKVYMYDRHYFPHDVRARELGSGVSREEMLRKLGVRPIVVPKHTVDDGIQSVRAILRRCYFDKKRCTNGLTHLEHYRKAFSDKLRCFTGRPVHDEHSHSADAFRYLAVAVHRSGGRGMTPDQAAEMYETYATNL